MKLDDDVLLVSKKSSSFNFLFDNSKGDLKNFWEVTNVNGSRRFLAGSDFYGFSEFNLYLMSSERDRFILKRVSGGFVSCFEVYLGDVLIGCFKKKFHFFRIEYEFYSSSGELLFVLKNRRFSRWEFVVIDSLSKDIISIVSRIAKDVFSEAITGRRYFQVDYLELDDFNEKLLILMSVFVVDLSLYKK